MDNKNKKNISEKMEIFYKKNYKKLMIIPILMFIISIGAIMYTYKQENSPIYRDVSLKGGLSAILEIESSIGYEELENRLNTKFPENSFVLSSLNQDGVEVGYIIDTDLAEEELLKELNLIFENKIKPSENYNSNYMSPTLSNAFFKQAIFALVFSFLFVSVVVFLYFREIVPSIAIVISGIFDIIVTVGILNLLGFKFSVAGIGTLIMLIGYSIDTDILLTNRLIKEDGNDYFEKTYYAFKTGMLMSFTTFIAALGAMIITNSPVIYEISFIIVIGLTVDVISTWIQNTGIILSWLEKKHPKAFK